MTTIKTLPVFLFGKILIEMVGRSVAGMIGMELGIVVSPRSCKFNFVSIVKNELLLSWFKNYLGLFAFLARHNVLLASHYSPNNPYWGSYSA